MPTKVIDIEFDAIPDLITNLDGYERAMVLVRIGAKPVDRVYVPVEGGKILGDTLRKAIVRNAGRVFWEFKLREVIDFPVKEDRNSQPPAITVAICTRDRPDDLFHCLEALTRIYPSDQEILVIDSCSANPEVIEVVRKFPSIRYVREDLPGLDRARNRAIREAQHEFIAFIDDDAMPDPNWLPALARNFDHPNTACVTGLTMPSELETKAQEEFEAYSTFSRGFERKEFDWSNTHPIGAGRIGVGNNMALRRTAVEQVGMFDEALDAGTPTCSGGDVEMFSRLIAAGYRIVYEPGALAWHRHRRGWSELRQTIYGYGVGVYAFWTRKILFEKEWWVLPVAIKWLFGEQIPLFVRSVFRYKRDPTFDMICHELYGCFSGPWLYFKSLRQNHRNAGQGDCNGLIQMLTPSVSVIIPTHNRQTYLRMSLNALARQSYPANRYEVVVVLDGCTDGSLEMLRNYRPPYRLQILEQEQKGASTARNHGARLSTGDLLVFLDDDVEATPGLILAHVKAHDGQNSRVAIGYYPPALAGQKALLSLHLLSWWEEMFHDMRETGHRFCHQDLLSGNLSIPRDIYQRVGGFDPDLPMREDFELGMRLIQADVGFTFVPEALGLHHEQAVITKSIRRKYVEGIADVRMGRKHPELIPTLLVRRLVSYSYLPSRLLQQLEFHSPRLAHWIATVGLSLLPGFERAHLVGLWRRLLYGVLAYWYWKGVTQELSTWKAIQDFLAPAMARGTVSSEPEVNHRSISWFRAGRANPGSSAP